MTPAADLYKLVAGTLIFVIFVTFGLLMTSTTFPDLVPTGFNPNNLKKISEPTAPAINVTACNVATLCLNMIIGPVVNFFNGAINAMSGIFAIVGSIFTFDVPAFQEMGSIGVLFRLLLMIPMVVAIGLLIVMLIKSVVPFVGGSPE